MRRRRAERPPAILIADDNASARLMCSTSLRAQGCTVYTANDGRAAIAKARDLNPDVIVMDLAMRYTPDVLWAEVCALLRLRGEPAAAG
jgi:CheY-like chemotaxis protein